MIFDIGSDFFNAVNLLGVFHNSLVNETLPGINASYSISNHTNTSSVIDETPIYDIETEVHQIWGIMSMMLIFLPGFVVGFPLAIKEILKGKWCYALYNLVVTISFPFFFIFMQLLAIIETGRKQEVDQKVQGFFTKLTATEAALESTGQLLLQILTILNGYPSTTIQKITICSSFFQIGRSVILQDIETKLFIKQEAPLSFCQSLLETLKRILFMCQT